MPRYSSESQKAFFQTLLLLCCCIFVIYQLQDSVLNSRSGKESRQPKSLTRNTKKFDTTSSSLSDPDNIRDSEQDVRLWITMGLCWSGNTKYHDKNKFPYKTAAPLAARLWHKFTPATVILQIVYVEDSPPQDLLDYKSNLESHGALVILREAKDMECVLKAQLIRLLAFKLPQVSPNDIVVTADVDAFVMTEDIAKPLIVLKHKKMWIYRYELTLGTGYTFMMPFIGARAQVWEEILEYEGDDGGSGLKKMVDKYGEYMKFKEGYTWDIDQHIVTHSILKSGVCSIPRSNKLWKEVNLEPKPVNDSNTCWHGSGIYEDCNNKLWTRNMMIRYHGQNCKWWHFYPDERESALQDKFDEINSGRSQSGIVGNLVGGAKQFKQNLMGVIGISQ